ncbi:hypothetical protein D3C80_2030130 [compost metagenome]
MIQEVRHTFLITGSPRFEVANDLDRAFQCLGGIERWVSPAGVSAIDRLGHVNADVLPLSVLHQEPEWLLDLFLKLIVLSNLQISIVIVQWHTCLL